MPANVMIVNAMFVLLAALAASARGRARSNGGGKARKPDPR